MGTLTWSFDTWPGYREFDREAPLLTVAAPCIWHGSGTNLSRRQSATTTGAPIDHARVCLAAPHRPQSRHRGLSSTRVSGDGRPGTTTGALSLGSSGHLEVVAELTETESAEGSQFGHIRSRDVARRHPLLLGTSVLYGLPLGDRSHLQRQGWAL